MQKKSRIIGAVLLLSLILFPSYLHAETRIPGGEVFGNFIWDKNGSPYILEDDIEFMPGSTVTIGPGVTIRSAPSYLTTFSKHPYWISQFKSERFDILGTEEEPVHIVDVSSIGLGENSKVEHTIFDGVDVYVSHGDIVNISSSVIKGTATALTIVGGIVSISDSQISGNQKGIYSGLYVLKPKAGDGPPFRKEYVGGYISTTTDPIQSSIIIRNTIFENNSKYSIDNINVNNIDATDNWWGNPNGPGATVYGAMITSPWLTKDPRLEPKPVKCCSSVLFLPGLQASRLYSPETGLFGTSTNQLWEPNRNDDVRKLFLNAEGQSLSAGIYTADIMESAFGLKDIYKKFAAMMNGVVAEQIIKEWLPFAYDWRMSVSNAVSLDARYATTTKNLVKEVERLAQSSKTGKVTVIAHSNGGLVAKMLGVELEKQGKSGLIDKVVFVAVPQLGTPQSVLGLLHGGSQAMLGGAILSSSVARSFGLNMVSAYGLLPSAEYFKKLLSPVITFVGKAVGTYDNFISFLKGQSDNRKQPKENEVKIPAILSSGILSLSQWMHSILDTWKFPPNIKVLSIAGWGMPTTKTLEYGGKFIGIKKGIDGDGTVLVGSATGYSGDQIYFNQALYQHNTKKSIFHADILQSDSILSFMGALLATTSKAFEEKPLPAYLSHQKPNASDYPWMSWVTVSVHSPVDMDIYDSQGGHIGAVPLPSDPSSDIKWLENTISGGQYEYIGDEKYVTLPGNDTYQIHLSGTDIGVFTLNVQKFSDLDMTEVASSTYSNLPVTSSMTANTIINSSNPAPPLEIDNDNNGTVDNVVNPCQAI